MKNNWVHGFGHGLCTKYIRPKFMHTKADAAKLAGIRKMYHFHCKHCDAWHLSKQKKKVKK